MEIEDRRDPRELARGMTPDALRAAIAECADQAAGWERHDREYGTHEGEAHEAIGEAYRAELRRRGEPVVKRCSEEVFCGSEFDLADEGDSGLELA